jgi:NadR type nicotinamide-nucleotide adenylyltransferase
VYASFVERVVLLGGESSGKSTLSEALARRFETAFVPEYGRELWERKDGQLVYEDLLAIGIEQIRREEEALLASRRWLICDTSPLTTLFYSREMFGRAEPRLEELAERRYDHVFLCAPDFDFVQDGTRREPGFRERQDAWYVRELDRRGIRWARVRGSLPERVERVANLLDASAH